jgi:CheY-like chemotaxis protein
MLKLRKKGNTKGRVLPDKVVAIVEDDLDVATLLKLKLDFDGITNVVILNPNEAFYYGASWRGVSAAIVDWMMPEHSGDEIIKEIRKQNELVPIAVYSAIVDVVQNIVVDDPLVTVISKLDIGQLELWISGNI